MGPKALVAECPNRPGRYIVNDQTWEVGQRYRLRKLLGSGSFSTVCLATDIQTGEEVALKRIPNVLQSVDNAKKVLREVCILRRLSHPNIISLKQAFARPSQTGPLRFRGGKLVPCSIDVYLALEYAGGGDLFSLRGQLSQEEVLRLTSELLDAVRYLHSQDVWHRDLKSANVLMKMEDGVRVTKLCDFGSARSANSRNGDDSALERLTRQRSISITSMDSFGSSLPISATGYGAPLTRQVCTPCYRAPEVVMSRGSYTSALDMWSIGCIFAELLQRIPYVGSAATPQLQIAPLFAVHGLPKTPSEGEKYANGPGNLQTRRELQALFDVIGTPAWSCIEAVQSKAWRNYLRNLPLRAGTLYRRFGLAGEPSVDLLSRLLTFDPSRRCNAQEAMMHELFVGLPLVGTQEMLDDLEAMEIEEVNVDKHAEGLSCPTGTGQRSPTVSPRYSEISDPAKALAALENELLELSVTDSKCEKLRALLENEMAALSSCAVDACSKAKARSTSPSKHPLRAENGWTVLVGDWYGLEVDPGPVMAPEMLAPGRLAHVADCYKAQLDTEKHLAAGRHGEWTETSGCGPEPGPAWGVTCFPPGLDEQLLDPRVKEVIQSQQMR